MIDFTDIAKNNPNFRAYGGNNGKKRGIIFNDEPYMLKIEHRNSRQKYMNSVISEYVASSIYAMTDIPTQKVILGIILDNNKKKLCVACKDFREKGELLYEFISIKNSVLEDNTSNGSETELNEILKAIDEQNFCKPELLRERFWDMFVVDAYLGNFDRHNGNWGILVNELSGERRLAPVYDCGFCLYPLATDEDLKTFLANEDELNIRVYDFPRSAIKVDNEKQKYHIFLQKTTNEDCLKSIAKLVPKIENRNKDIHQFINSINILSSVRKEFYNKILALRKEKILLPAWQRANSIL